MQIKNTSIQETVIQRVKSLRINNNISQLQLGSILGISSGQVGNIESPRFQHKYTLKQIYLFCEHINYPFEKIFLTDDELKETDNQTNLLIKKIIEYDE